VGFDQVDAAAAVANAENPGALARERLGNELGATLADTVIAQVEVGVKYAGYIDKQNLGVARAAHYEGLRLPADIDYARVFALSHEVRQRLNQHRPETLGQAARLPGVTAAAVSLLLVHLKKGGLAAPDSDTASAMTHGADGTGAVSTPESARRDAA
jgi:tRNA uridine 5-carboxymethylaminomethyl modification enzyme